MDGIVESDEQRMLRELRTAAEAAVEGLAKAMQLAGLPTLPSAGLIHLLPQGVHVGLGGCNVHTIKEFTDFVLTHPRCMSRVHQGQIVPSGLAQLPSLPTAVTDATVVP